MGLKHARSALALTPRAALQDALESTYVSSLFARFGPPTSGPESALQVQAVFCIDVRSEPMRRHLEAQSPSIQTRGFAGFFGVGLDMCSDHGNSPRCPVLLKPSFSVSVKDGGRGRSAGSPWVKELAAAPGMAFSFVEALGSLYGLAMLRESIFGGATQDAGEREAALGKLVRADGQELSLEGQVDLAQGILTGMGLRDQFAPIVLLCGHESHSANNPHAAGLECGACGGHGGAVNARVAARLLNTPEVRSGLGARGWTIPRETWFVAGVHQTATDHVMLLDIDEAPAHQREPIRKLRGWLEAAERGVRKERQGALGVSVSDAGKLERALQKRSRDWSEVRTEWALAGNAAFIAARRERTRQVDLEGRAFLHEYDFRTDPECRLLTLILSAPMVVASWINLQYFASTVDNHRFGSGDKALHNRVDTLGVVLGNGGDLQVGLPLQSVRMPDGSWRHEPLRLQVVIEAPTDRIDTVIQSTPTVRNLVVNQWIRIHALSPDVNRAWSLNPDGIWEEHA